jgi:hypothetical protein
MVLELQNENHSVIKNAMEKNIFSFLDSRGYSHEEINMNTLHHRDDLKPLYELGTIAMKQFVAQFAVDPELFDYNITKSWLSIVNQHSVPSHAHMESHLSFIYYANIPDGGTYPITFYRHLRHDEPFWNMSKWNNPREWNPFNSYGTSFQAKEGTLYVFPSGTYHGVEGVPNIMDDGIKTLDDYRKRRVCIASDVMLTYKETSFKSYGLQPIKNWRTF